MGSERVISESAHELHPQASVVMVNWNTRELALQCIYSLKKSLANFPTEIIVVDNDSTDGSADARS